MFLLSPPHRNLYLPLEIVCMCVFSVLVQLEVLSYLKAQRIIPQLLSLALQFYF